MMNVYLDVDRTLFDTSKFDALRWELLGREYGVSAEAGRSSQQQFYRYSGDMYTYDFAAHMQNIGLDIEEAGSMLLRSELADGRLEYDGVGELVAWIQEQGMVRLLTYGMRDYQLLKIALCPSIKDLEVATTLDTKDTFFIQHPEPAVLLDDKPIREILPPHVTFVQSVEYNDITPPAAVSWPVARSLDEFRQFLEDMYA